MKFQDDLYWENILEGMTTTQEKITRVGQILLNRKEYDDETQEITDAI